MQSNIRLVLQDVALGGDTTVEECFDQRVVSLSNHSNQLVERLLALKFINTDCEHQQVPKVAKDFLDQDQLLF